MKIPRVSVLMTTWNGAAHLRESLDSVWAQSFTDFELVVVDDGSTDATPTILAAIADPRLRVLRPGRNLGIVGARNLGFAACRGSYLAALDHDDLSTPDRLAAQVAYLDAHPGTVLVGSAIRLLGARAHHQPQAPSPALLRWLLLVGNPFTWSSVMLRVDAVRRLGAFMRPDYELADDFDLYHRLLGEGEVARLTQVLTIYRWHAGNTTHAHAARQSAVAARVLAEAYRPWLGGGAEAAAALVVDMLVNSQVAADAAALARLGEVLHALRGRCGPAVYADAARQWWHAARAAIRSGVPGAHAAWRAQTALRGEFDPRAADQAMSRLIGGVRAPLRYRSS